MQRHAHVAREIERNSQTSLQLPESIGNKGGVFRFHAYHLALCRSDYRVIELSRYDVMWETTSIVESSK